MTKTFKKGEEALLAIIGDEDTVTGFLLAGIGEVNNLTRKANFLIVDGDVPHSQIEGQFKEFITRKDIAIILINQHIANDIRYLLDEYTQTLPAIIEIPSKDHKYEEEKDSILKRVRFFFGEK